MYIGNKAMVSVVIAAAGKGTRMGIAQNKQYVDVLGKPVIARTIQAFENCSLINEIIIVANGAEIEYCRENVVDRYGFGKVREITAGGESRQKSVFNGLKKVDRSCAIVLIHDGARPFISEETIRRSIEAAEESGAAVAAVPVKDTIKRSNAEGFVNETLDRNTLWSIQTPQVFRRQLIVEAHEKAEMDGFDGTDDAVLVERLGHGIKLVMGSYYNIKITTLEDLAIAGAIADMDL